MINGTLLPNNSTPEAVPAAGCTRTAAPPAPTASAAAMARLLDPAADLETCQGRGDNLDGM